MNAIALTISNISVRQDSQGRFCLNDLHKASGDNPNQRPSNWLRNQQAKDLIEELSSNLSFGPVEAVKGGNSPGVFVVKELVYAYAMWISAKFHIAVIRAYDALVNSPQPRYGLVELPEPPTINRTQQGELFNRVSAIAAGSGKIRAEIWSRFQNHFKLASYKDLPADQYDDALTYLTEKQAEYVGADVEMLYLSNKELESRIDARIKAIEGERLNHPSTDTIVVLLNDNPAIQSMKLRLTAKGQQYSRHYVQVDNGEVVIEDVPVGSYVMTEAKFINWMQDRGFIVVKKSEVAAKLMS